MCKVTLDSVNLHLHQILNCSADLSNPNPFIASQPILLPAPRFVQGHSEREDEYLLCQALALPGTMSQGFGGWHSDLGQLQQQHPPCAKGGESSVAPALELDSSCLEGAGVGILSPAQLLRFPRAALPCPGEAKAAVQSLAAELLAELLLEAPAGVGSVLLRETRFEL